MPTIEEGIKLDFKDVLLRPKRSTLKSRAEVDLARSYHFKNSGQQYNGIPIIAANMDTIGTFEMALALNKVSAAMFALVCLHSNTLFSRPCSTIVSRPSTSTTALRNGPSL